MNNEIVKGLRELADFVERTDFPINPFRVLSGWNSVADFTEQLKKLGSFDKKIDDVHVRCIKKFPGGIEFEVYILKNLTCKRILKETRIIPATPEIIIPAEQEREENIYEWECPESLLGLNEKEKELSVNG